MKLLVANLFLILLPLVIFLVAFYLTAGFLSREITVVDISSKISNIINEAEIYKEEIKKIVLEKVSENLSVEKIKFEAYYVNFEVNVIDRYDNKIVYEVFAKPKETIQGIRIIIHFIDEIEL